jgi:hypothetical protein
MIQENEKLDNPQNPQLNINVVSGSFVCYLCENIFNRVGEPCMHYEEDEMDDEGEVSLCDECSKKAMEKAKMENIQGLSRRFFNCH